ncbi:MAG: hypothetical protein Q7R65_02515 [bacterium]|nr:hypothetical protein [bacterium]
MKSHLFPLSPLIYLSAVLVIASSIFYTYTQPVAGDITKVTCSPAPGSASGGFSGNLPLTLGSNGSLNGSADTGNLTAGRTFQIDCTDRTDSGNPVPLPPDTATVNVAAPIVSQPNLVSFAPTVNGSTDLGSVVTLEGFVENRGTKDINQSFRNEFSWQDPNTLVWTPISASNVNGLAAGIKSAKLTSALWILPYTKGNYLVRLCADQPPKPNGVVVELDKDGNPGESDNCATRPIIVNDSTLPPVCTATLCQAEDPVTGNMVSTVNIGEEWKWKIYYDTSVRNGIPVCSSQNMDIWWKGPWVRQSGWYYDSVSVSPPRSGVFAGQEVQFTDTVRLQQFNLICSTVTVLPGPPIPTFGLSVNPTANMTFVGLTASSNKVGMFILPANNFDKDVRISASPSKITVGVNRAELTLTYKFYNRATGVEIQNPVISSVPYDTIDMVIEGKADERIPTGTYATTITVTGTSPGFPSIPQSVILNINSVKPAFEEF